MISRYDLSSLEVAAYATEMRRASESVESMMSAHTVARFLEMQNSIERFTASHAAIARQLEAFRTSLSDSLLVSSRMVDQIQSQLSAATVASTRVMNEFAASAAAAQSHVDSLLASVDMAKFGSISRVSTFDYGASLARHIDAAQRMAQTLVAGIDVERFRPVLDRIDQMVVDAPDEQTRRLTFTAALAAAFEAITDAELEFDSPKKRMKFFFVLALFIWLRIAAVHQEQAHRTELADVRRVQREQAETVAALTETVVQLTAEAAGRREAPDSLLEIGKTGTLRAAPSGKSARIGSLRGGQLVRLLSTWKRWSYIELLDDELHGTEERGWIYRRQVRRSGAKPK